eukprot:TRINITY_DN13000_c0_g1_i1.p1 TRINITY_DN13000_c0_g1~~TRINITY_DN13000_c0_g1_i1.p1  ORF type:complete len:934 (+),score=134.77 TRINITY_DN13000_c0_g1_i1:244-2802(+)
MTVYLMYLHRFMLAFGKDRIMPWRDVILNTYNLETKDLKLQDVVKNLLQVLMVEDNSIRDAVFSYYFKSLTPVSLNAITGYAELQMKNFFTHLKNYMIQPLTRTIAMELLCMIVHHQGPRLHEIVGTPAFPLLLQLLKKEKNTIVVSLGLWTLTMLLPNLLAALPPILPQLFYILKRVMMWHKVTAEPISDDASAETEKTAALSSSPEKTGMLREPSTTASSASTVPNAEQTPGPPPPEIGRAATVFFYHLYGMFPCNFMTYLRTQSTTDPEFFQIIRPLIVSLPLNISLITTTEETELQLDRWRNKEPHTIVTQCMGENHYLYQMALKDIQNDIKTRHVLPLNPTPDRSDVDGDWDVDLDAVVQEAKRSKPQESANISIEAHNDDSDEEISTSWQDEVELLCEEIESTMLMHGDLEPHDKGRRRASSTIATRLHPSEFDQEYIELDDMQPPADSAPAIPSGALPPAAKRKRFERAKSEKAVGGIFHHVIGQKIMYIQHLLENNLLLGSELDPWAAHSRSVQKGREKPIALPSDLIVLQQQLLILRNELLFERYLRTQLFRRFGSLQRDFLSAVSSDANSSAMAEKILEQRAEHERMQAMMLAEQQELHELSSRHRKWSEELHERTKKITVHSQALEKANDRLLFQLRYKDDDLKHLQRALDQASSRVKELEIKLADASGQLFQQEDLQRKTKQLNEDLLMWGQRHATGAFADGTKEIDSLKLSIKERDALIQSLHEQLGESAKSHRSLQALFLDVKEKLSKLEREKDQKESLTSAQKQLLEYHKQITIQKILAVESKYDCIRGINTALEKHILRLEAELERVKQQSLTAISHPNATDSTTGSVSQPTSTTS